MDRDNLEEAVMVSTTGMLSVPGHLAGARCAGCSSQTVEVAAGPSGQWS